MIGTTLDKYEVLQKVGEGGMATVYRGRHSTLHRDVAIKVLHPHLSSSSRNRLRFAREAKAVERLRHRNILEIFDYSGNDAEDCYIVTEFVEGETLTHLLHRTGHLPSEAVAAIGVEIARALGYAHREGILHRDLKTDNVMVRTDGAVKLMDFGIARFLDESQVTMTGALVGSPAFMSPEQAQELALDTRSDLFSLGTVMFYLVTGNLPFSGSNPSLILKNVIEGNRPHVTELAPSMSASLAAVVEQLLSTHPDDRFVSAASVEQALLACLSETRVDPTAARWSVQAFVDEPEAWARRLDEHLTTVLAEEGRRKLDEGDHLAALRLFNRLLSMDEDNEEVLSLVRNLHGAPPDPPSVWARLVPLLIVVVLGLVGVWQLARPASETADPAAVALRDTMVVSDTPTARSAPPASGPGPAATAAESAAAEVPGPGDRAPAEPVGPSAADARDAIDASTSAGDPPPSPPVRTSPPRAPAVARSVTVAPADAPPGEPDAPSPPRTAEPAFGSLWVNAGELTAEVFVGERRLGPTLDEIVMPVGTYDLRIVSPFARPYVEPAVEIVADQRTVVEVSLTLNPRRVEFVGWADDCRAVVDGVDEGTLGELSHYWTVARPDRPTQITVTCADGEPHVERWDYLTGDVELAVPARGRPRRRD